MKLENLKNVAKAGEDYERAVANLRWVQEAKYFDAGCGPRSDATINTNGSTNAVREDMSSYSGQLASDIKAALLRFREGHVALAEQRLKELGVEVPARPSGS